MKFDTDWRALGKHRIRLRSAKGFLTEVMHQLAEVTRTTVDNNMSARARVVDIVFRQEKTYHIAVGSTVAEDRICAPQREPALAAATDLVPDQINLNVRIKAQEEVEPYFAVYERMHTACRRAPYDRLSSVRSFIHAPCTPSRLWRPY